MIGLTASPWQPKASLADYEKSKILERSKRGKRGKAQSMEDKRKCFDRLDVRGKLALENGDKVVYAKCRIGKQRLSVVATSP